MLLSKRLFPESEIAQSCVSSSSDFLSSWTPTGYYFSARSSCELSVFRLLSVTAAAGSAATFAGQLTTTTDEALFLCSEAAAPLLARACLVVSDELVGTQLLLELTDTGNGTHTGQRGWWNRCGSALLLVLIQPEAEVALLFFYAD